MLAAGWRLRSINVVYANKSIFSYYRVKFQISSSAVLLIFVCRSLSLAFESLRQIPSGCQLSSSALV